jgi:hypothetical protein
MRKLTKLAQVSLDTRFAEVNEDGSVTHYIIPVGEYMGKDAFHTTPEEVLKAHLNEEIEITNPIAPHTLTVQELTNFFPENSPLEAALRQMQLKSVLHTYNVLISRQPLPIRALGYVTRTINIGIDAINRVIFKLRFGGKNIFDPSITQKQFEQLTKFSTETWGIRRLPEYRDNYKRCISPADILTVTYEAGFEEQAKAELLKDLTKIHETIGIIGHLSMPSTLLLADTVGKGKTRGVLFAMIFADYERLYAVTGKDFKELERLPLNTELGIRSNTHEGGLVDYPEFHTPTPSIQEVVVSPRLDKERELIQQIFGKKPKTE